MGRGRKHARVKVAMEQNHVYELDLMDSKQAAAVKANAQVSEKGMQLGKGKGGTGRRLLFIAAVTSRIRLTCSSAWWMPSTFPGTRWRTNSAQQLKKSEITRWRRCKESHRQVLRQTFELRARWRHLCKRPSSRRPKLERDRDGMACVF